MRIVYGADREVAQFVGRRIGFRENRFSDCAALGIIDRHGKPVAGAVFHDYSPDSATMQASIAALPRRVWCTRRILAGLLAYPFLQIGVRQLYAMSKSTNAAAIDFNARLGFVGAGKIDQYFPDADAVVMRMPRDFFLRNFLPDLPAMTTRKEAA